MGDPRVWSGTRARGWIQSHWRARRETEVAVYSAIGYMQSRLSQAGEAAGRLLRSRRGQGTVEYVALVLLIGLVMFGVVTAMRTYKFADGQQLGDLIVEKIKDAVSKVRY